MLLAFPRHWSISIMLARRCCLANSTGTSCSRMCKEFSWSWKDWFNSFSCGIPAHCLFSFSMQISSASHFAFSARGKNHFGCWTSIPSRVWIGVFTYPLKAVVPRMFAMSSSQFLSLNCKFSMGVVPNTGWTWHMGVSLSKGLSSIDVGRSWGIQISGSSTAHSCWGAGILWGIGGVSNGDGSV